MTDFQFFASLFSQEFVAVVTAKKPEVMKYAKLSVKCQSTELLDTIKREHAGLGKQWAQLMQKQQKWGKLLNACLGSWEKAVEVEGDLKELEEWLAKWGPPAEDQAILMQNADLQVRGEWREERGRKGGKKGGGRKGGKKGGGRKGGKKGGGRKERGRVGGREEGGRVGRREEGGWREEGWEEGRREEGWREEGERKGGGRKGGKKGGGRMERGRVGRREEGGRVAGREEGGRREGDGRERGTGRGRVQKGGEREERRKEEEERAVEGKME